MNFVIIDSFLFSGNKKRTYCTFNYYNFIYIFSSFFTHLPPNNNIQQYSLETKKQFLFDNLSEELKTWSSNNALPNQTSYKFIAMQRSGADPYLGGGNITIEGHKSDDNHEWQKATTYYSGTKFIKFRDKLVGKWSDWEKVVFNSDLKPIIGTPITNIIPSRKGTTVNRISNLSPGTYMIYGFAQYTTEFSETCNYSLYQDNSLISICRANSIGGGGQTPFGIVSFDTISNLEFNLYQSSNDTKEIVRSNLVAVRLN